MKGALLVAGTASDAGKSTVVAALCRWLRAAGRVGRAVQGAEHVAELDGHAERRGDRPGAGDAGRGVRDRARGGDEPGPDQAVRAPSQPGAGDGQARTRTPPRAPTRSSRPQLREPVLDGARTTCASASTSSSARARAARPRSTCATATSRTWASRAPPTCRCCWSATSTAAASSPSLYGTLALLEPEDQALIAGFVINKFRGDPSILAPGLEMLRGLTGRPTLGVLPWLDGPLHRRRGLARRRHRDASAARSTSSSSACAG